MLSEARLKFLKKMIILGPKTAILGPQFCRILLLGPHFWWSGGGPGPRGPPGSAPGVHIFINVTRREVNMFVVNVQVGSKSIVLMDCLGSFGRVRTKDQGLFNQLT